MIVIPMAGLSSRFFKAGFDKPKYMLEAHGMTLFEHSVNSFARYFKQEHFLFIIRDVFHTLDFVDEKVKSLGIMSYDIICLEQETRGQAETVSLGLAQWQQQAKPTAATALTIFNIDTFRPDYTVPQVANLGDGYLEVFKGSGNNWSYVKPQVEGLSRVAETAEKNPISDLCCTGLYHFNSLEAYFKAYDAYLNSPEDWVNGELYIAPIYNKLIAEGAHIHFHIIARKQVIFCGVPDEYYQFLADDGEPDQCDF